MVTQERYGECGGGRVCAEVERSGEGMRRVWWIFSKTAKKSSRDDARCLDGAELLRCCAPEQNHPDGTVK